MAVVFGVKMLCSLYLKPKIGWISMTFCCRKLPKHNMHRLLIYIWFQVHQFFQKFMLRVEKPCQGDLSVLLLCLLLFCFRYATACASVYCVMMLANSSCFKQKYSKVMLKKSFSYSQLLFELHQMRHFTAWNMLLSFTVAVRNYFIFIKYNFFKVTHKCICFWFEYLYCLVTVLLKQ